MVGGATDKLMFRRVHQDELLAGLGRRRERLSTYHRALLPGVATARSYDTVLTRTRDLLAGRIPLRHWRNHLLSYRYWFEGWTFTVAPPTFLFCENPNPRTSPNTGLPTY